MEVDFLIDAFDWDKPLILKHPFKRKQFLSCSTGTYTGLEEKWIIEKEEETSTVYIRSVTAPLRYLGAPNSDNKTHVYRTRGRFTQWSLVGMQGELVTFKYVGQQFNTEDLQIVVAARPTDDITWSAAYSDIAAVYIGEWKGQMFLQHIIANYGALKPRIFFFGANPLQYNSNALLAIEHYDLLPAETVPLGLMLPTTTSTTTTPYGLQYNTVTLLRDGMFAQKDCMNDKEGRTLIGEYRKKYPIAKPAVENFLLRASIKDNSMSYASTYGGILATTPAMIEHRSKDAYTSILNSLQENPEINDRILERLWLYLLTRTKK